MDNHYHLVVETPELILVRGMRPLADGKVVTAIAKAQTKPLRPTMHEIVATVG
jgi:hypothetical protein